MTEGEAELVLQKAKEKYPEREAPRDPRHGPQLVAREFKQFIRISGMDHVRTSPYYYVTPCARLAGRHMQIWEERDRQLEAARARRAARREQARERAASAGVAVVG
jgi:hypothetical protein